MITKIFHTVAVDDLMAYVFAPGKSPEVITYTMASADPGAALADLRGYARRHGGVARPYAHIVLSLEPGESLSKLAWADVIDEYMKAMGYGMCAYIAASHGDRAHEHVHVIASRIDGKGRRVSDSFERYRTQEIARALEKKHNLSPTPSAWDSGRDRGESHGEYFRARRTGARSRKRALRALVDAELADKKPTLPGLITALEERGVTTRLRLGVADSASAKEPEVEVLGLSFLYEGLPVAASKLRRRFGFTKLARALGFDPSRDLPALLPPPITDGSRPSHVDVDVAMIAARQRSLRAWMDQCEAEGGEVVHDPDSYEGVWRGAFMREGRVRFGLIEGQGGLAVLDLERSPIDLVTADFGEDGELVLGEDVRARVGALPYGHAVILTPREGEVRALALTPEHSEEARYRRLVLAHAPGVIITHAPDITEGLWEGVVRSPDGTRSGALRYGKYRRLVPLEGVRPREDMGIGEERLTEREDPSALPAGVWTMLGEDQGETRTLTALHNTYTRKMMLLTTSERYCSPSFSRVDGRWGGHFIDHERGCFGVVTSPGGTSIIRLATDEGGVHATFDADGALVVDASEKPRALEDIPMGHHACFEPGGRARGMSPLFLSAHSKEESIAFARYDAMVTRLAAEGVTIEPRGEGFAGYYEGTFVTRDGQQRVLLRYGQTASWIDVDDATTFQDAEFDRKGEVTWISETASPISQLRERDYVILSNDASSTQFLYTEPPLKRLTTLFENSSIWGTPEHFEGVWRGEVYDNKHKRWGVITDTHRRIGLIDLDEALALRRGWRDEDGELFDKGALDALPASGTLVTYRRGEGGEEPSRLMTVNKTHARARYEAESYEWATSEGFLSKPGAFEARDGATGRLITTLRDSEYSDYAVLETADGTRAVIRIDGGWEYHREVMREGGAVETQRHPRPSFADLSPGALYTITPPADGMDEFGEEGRYAITEHMDDYARARATFERHGYNVSLGSGLTSGTWAGHTVSASGQRFGVLLDGKQARFVRLFGEPSFSRGEPLYAFGGTVVRPGELLTRGTELPFVSHAPAEVTGRFTGIIEGEGGEQLVRIEHRDGVALVPHHEQLQIISGWRGDNGQLRPEKTTGVSLSTGDEVTLEGDVLCKLTPSPLSLLAREDARRDARWRAREVTPQFAATGVMVGLTKKKSGMQSVVLVGEDGDHVRVLFEPGKIDYFEATPTYERDGQRLPRDLEHMAIPAGARLSLKTTRGRVEVTHIPDSTRELTEALRALGVRVRVREDGVVSGRYIGYALDDQRRVHGAIEVGEEVILAPLDERPRVERGEQVFLCDGELFDERGLYEARDRLEAVSVDPPRFEGRLARLPEGDAMGRIDGARGVAFISADATPEYAHGWHDLDGKLWRKRALETPPPPGALVAYRAPSTGRDATLLTIDETSRQARSRGQSLEVREALWAREGLKAMTYADRASGRLLGVYTNRHRGAYAVVLEENTPVAVDLGERSETRLFIEQPDGRALRDKEGAVFDLTPGEQVEVLAPGSLDGQPAEVIRRQDDYTRLISQLDRQGYDVRVGEGVVYGHLTREVASANGQRFGVVERDGVAFMTRLGHERSAAEADTREPVVVERGVVYSETEYLEKLTEEHGHKPDLEDSARLISARALSAKLEQLSRSMNRDAGSQLVLELRRRAKVLQAARTREAMPTFNARTWLEARARMTPSPTTLSEYIERQGEDGVAARALTEGDRTTGRLKYQDVTLEEGRFFVVVEDSGAHVLVEDRGEDVARLRGRSVTVVHEARPVVLAKQAPADPPTLIYGVDAPPKPLTDAEALERANARIHAERVRRERESLPTLAEVLEPTPGQARAENEPAARVLAPGESVEGELQKELVETREGQRYHVVIDTNGARVLVQENEELARAGMKRVHLHLGEETGQLLVMRGRDVERGPKL